MKNFSNYDELDRAIEALIADPELPLSGEQAELTELLEIVSDLRQLPDPGFRMRLKTELEWVASERPLSVASPMVSTVNDAHRDVMPSLFANGAGAYPMRSVNFIVSLAVHGAAMALILALGLAAINTQSRPVVGHSVITLSEYIPAVGSLRPHGGGGGGDHSNASVSHGALPRTAAEQLTPPVVVIHNLDPRLTAQPTVIAPNLNVPQTIQVGDPLSAVTTPSNGMGVSSGIGAGSHGGVGPGDGPGFGRGTGGNFGGSVFNVGSGVTAPRLVYDPEPEYSQEARASKQQGTVVLSGIIGADGRPHDLKVKQPLGLGLDEKALEAVLNWRFEPATKDGHPVAVRMEIDVNFHLY